MSRLIKLPGNETIYVASDMIASIAPNSYRTGIIVELKDGTRHLCEPDYNASIYATIDRLVGEVNSCEPN